METRTYSKIAAPLVVYASAANKLAVATSTVAATLAACSWLLAYSIIKWFLKNDITLLMNFVECDPLSFFFGFRK